MPKRKNNLFLSWIYPQWCSRTICYLFGVQRIYPVMFGGASSAGSQSNTPQLCKNAILPKNEMQPLCEVLFNFMLVLMKKKTG